MRLEGGSVGGGIGVFAGIPLVIAGIALLGDAWNQVSIYLDGPGPELAKALAGWVLAIAGSALALASDSWVLDERSRTFARRRRLLRWTWWRNAVGFDSIRAVRCTRQIAGNGAHEAFAVEIVLPGDKICRIATRVGLQEALETAAWIGEVVDAPVG